MDISGYGTIRQHSFGARGGGRRRAKPLLQYSKKHWMKELGDGCWHASPKPPDAQRAGGISDMELSFGTCRESSDSLYLSGQSSCENLNASFWSTLVCSGLVNLLLNWLFIATLTEL